jgi:hypothetical protein
MPRIAHRNGKVAVVDQSQYPQAVDDPAAYRNSVYWHSDRDYLRILYDETRAVTFPSRGSGSNTQFGETIHDVFPAHNLGFRPRGVLRIGNTQFPTCGIHDYSGGDKFRQIRAEITETTVTLREIWIIDGSYAGLTINCRVILYGVPTAGASTRPVHFTPATGRLVAGYGKLDTDHRYLREDRSGAPDFWMTSGRTIDTNANAFRQVLPNGQVSDFGYTGSFTGTGFFGVAD